MKFLVHGYFSTVMINNLASLNSEDKMFYACEFCTHAPCKWQLTFSLFVTLNQDYLLMYE